MESPIPDGYRPVWKDDRLNEQRGHQTFDGIYASGLAWTRTVPRKLYVRSTGLVVTHKYPGLMYPYHSYDEMRAAGYDAAISDTAMAPQTRQKVVRRSAPKKGHSGDQIGQTHRACRSCKGPVRAGWHLWGRSQRPAHSVAAAKYGYACTVGGG